MEKQELTENIEDLLQLSNDAVDSPLSRVWLNGPGDLCGECPMRPECPDQSRCLHLTASAGLTRRIDGPFRRFPLGARKVGEVAITRTPYVLSQDLAGAGLAEATWLATHRVRSFAALPIVHGERCLGVLALFSRREITAPELGLLEGAARCAAAIVAASRERASREIARPGGERVASADPTGDPGAQETPSARELRTLAAIEREAIERVLRHTAGRVSGPHGAAKILGLKPTTLESRMKKLGARKPPRTRGR
jgi:transcriptional regulator with GAF, ATPase, and Fis domain